MADRIFLKDFEKAAKSTTPMGRELGAAEGMGHPVPQILFLFLGKPELTQHLAAFTHELMRGPSDLTAGMRELVAAYTSSRNQCLF